MIALMLALLVFLFPLAYSPGPGNMFFAANGARFGVRATLPASAGYHLATWIVTAAIGFGFAATLERFPQLFVAIKWAGSAYVLYLAWKLFRAGAIENMGEARPAGFMDGVVLLVLNPKAYVIIALMFTQFLSSGGED
ncbi:MAG: LysE family translocator [Hyphomonas sp.]